MSDYVHPNNKKRFTNGRENSTEIGIGLSIFYGGLWFCTTKLGKKMKNSNQNIEKKNLVIDISVVKSVIKLV